MPQLRNPLKQILDVRHEEIPLALLMFSYFFLVITTFWILKPLKKGLFIGYYDEVGFDLFTSHFTAAQAELLAKVLNMGVAMVAVTVFTMLVRSFQRQRLTYIYSAFFIVAYVLYAFVLDAPGPLTVWSFYLFGDLYSTLMVATFFAFLNDSVRPDAAKRLYGIIGLGGVVGGAFGSTVLRANIRDLTMAGWLWVCLAAALLIVLIATAAGRRVASGQPEASPGHDAPSQGSPAMEGARLVLRSRYLLAIVAIVGLYEMVSTIMDFQFSATVAHYLDGPAIGAHFAAVYAFTNWTALVVQLFLTSFVMTRFGVGVALLFLPVAALLGSTGFLIAPVLLVGSLLNTADNGFSYSINQSAKEVLYVPTPREEKYKAKAFIDMFVQRFAKALAVGLNLLFTMTISGFAGVRWLSLATVAILAVWILAVRYAGRRFNELADTAPAQTT